MIWESKNSIITMHNKLLIYLVYSQCWIGQKKISYNNLIKNRFSGSQRESAPSHSHPHKWNCNVARYVCASAIIIGSLELRTYSFFRLHLRGKSSAARLFIIRPCREKRASASFSLSQKLAHSRYIAYCWETAREKEIDFPSPCPFSHPRRCPVCPLKRNSARAH